jgi:general secretion pathway protein G
MLRNQNKNLKSGFTLIELLVVVAIIALLSSIALIALVSARQKSRNVKRLSDMTQMNTALELYFTYNRGYPSSTTPGVPDDLNPTFLVHYPTAPTPADGACGSLTHPAPVPEGVIANNYYYVPVNPIGNGLFRDYEYHFCLGDTTGNFEAGPKKMTPSGVR